jgi:ABC-2 type transport system ATP-binding protein
MVGFLGPNGAGKSTTLYMTAGLVHPSAGTMEVFGHNVRRRFKDAMRHAAAMVEIPAFYTYLSGKKNLALFGRLRGSVSDTQIDQILKRVGLYDRRGDRVSSYSHGMKQRLGVAATMLGNPKLLLLDEPTSGMDPEATREILTLLRERAHSEGLAVFLSSHLLYEVEEYCDRVIVIHQGRAVASGQVSDILAPHENVLRVTFRGRVPDCGDLETQEGIQRAETVLDDTLEITLADRDASWLNAYLLNSGYKVSALVPKQKTLKDFFLSITGEQNS